MEQGMKRPRGARLGVLLALKAWLLVLLAAGPSQADSPQGNGQVFVIHSYHSGLSWTDSIADGIRDTFAGSGGDIQLSAEFLDARRYVDPERASLWSKGIRSSERT